MTEDGCTIATEQIGQAMALIGHRAEFRVSWMLTRLHLLTVVAAVDTVTEADIRDFVTEVDSYAKATKGRLRGMQSGVVSFAALVSSQVDSGAKEFAEQKPKAAFAAQVRPVVIDLATGQAHTFQGTQQWGRIYQSYLRQKVALYLP